MNLTCLWHYHVIDHRGRTVYVSRHRLPGHTNVPCFRPFTYWNGEAWVKSQGNLPPDHCQAGRV